jgi:hypothetical protein
MLGARLEGLFAEAAKARMLAGKPAADPGENLRQGRAPRASDEAAASVGVSGRSVQTAKRVLERGAPELVAAVDSGSIAVSAAATLADAPHEEQVRAVAGGRKAVAAVVKKTKTRTVDVRALTITAPEGRFQDTAIHVVIEKAPPTDAPPANDTAEHAPSPPPDLDMARRMLEATILVQSSCGADRQAWREELEFAIETLKEALIASGRAQTWRIRGAAAIEEAMRAGRILSFYPDSSSPRDDIGPIEAKKLAASAEDPDCMRNWFCIDVAEPPPVPVKTVKKGPRR